MQQGLRIVFFFCLEITFVSDVVSYFLSNIFHNFYHIIITAVQAQALMDESSKLELTEEVDEEYEEIREDFKDSIKV